MPLSRTAVRDLVADALEAQPDGSFAGACYEATRGNPFMLHELLIELEAAGIARDTNASRVAGFGSRRVSERVLARVRRLGVATEALTRALAFLG